MDQKKIDRINELSRKSKAEGLTDEEKQEQLFLRREYVDSVVGALRGDEVQQLYVCARLVSFLREVEKEDGVQPGKSVMIVPTVIGASMNEGSRLWEPENMDINRRFPGDVTGSTTERIAGALLDRHKN